MLDFTQTPGPQINVRGFYFKLDSKEPVVNSTQRLFEARRLSEKIRYVSYSTSVINSISFLSYIDNDKTSTYFLYHLVGYFRYRHNFVGSVCSEQLWNLEGAVWLHDPAHYKYRYNWFVVNYWFIQYTFSNTAWKKKNEEKAKTTTTTKTRTRIILQVCQLSETINIASSWEIILKSYRTTTCKNAFIFVALVTLT